MPEVTIEQSTFERLQQHARPLIDTTDSVIVRALDALDERGGSSARADQVLKLPPRNQPLGALAFGPNMPLPDVRHTRMLAASIDGEPVGPTAIGPTCFASCSSVRRSTMATLRSSGGGAL